MHYGSTFNGYDILIIQTKLLLCYAFILYYLLLCYVRLYVIIVAYWKNCFVVICLHTTDTLVPIITISSNRIFSTKRIWVNCYSFWNHEITVGLRYNINFFYPRLSKICIWKWSIPQDNYACVVLTSCIKVMSARMLKISTFVIHICCNTWDYTYSCLTIRTF